MTAVVDDVGFVATSPTDCRRLIGNMDTVLPPRTTKKRVCLSVCRAWFSSVPRLTRQQHQRSSDELYDDSGENPARGKRVGLYNPIGRRVVRGRLGWVHYSKSLFSSDIMTLF